MTIQQIPCEAHEDCLHLPCRGCRRPLAQGLDSTTDHPGSRKHRHSMLCNPCVKETGALTEKDLQDERYMILQDHQMETMAEHHPTQYAWHIARRRKLRLPLPGNTPPLREDGLLVGVTRVGKKWKVQLTQQGRKNYYGIYDTPEEATQVAIREYTKGLRK